MPLGSGFAHPSTSGESLDRVLGVGPEPAQAQGTLAGGPEVAQPPSVLCRPSVSFVASAEPDLAGQEPEDEEEDDRDSVSPSPVVDKMHDRLINYVYNQYSESGPPAPPCCAFEDFFAVVDPQASTRPRLCVYPRVEELVAQTQDRAAKLARESRPLHRVLPLKRRVFPVADDPDYTTPRWLNPDFVRLAGNKTIAKARAGTMSFADIEKVEKCFRTFLGGHSQSFWLLSALLSQLKQDGFHPSDPVLFDKTILSLSATLAAGLADFVVAKHHESYLAHVSLPLSALQKRELLVTPWSDMSLFDQSLLERVLGQVKEDSFISSSLSLAKLAKSGSRGRSSGGAAQGAGSSCYSSPLKFSCPSPSGYGKRSTSPARGNRAKRGCSGRGVSPSPNTRKGFRK